MKIFECAACLQILHFENTRCLQCGRELGYLPDEAAVTPLEPAGNDTWKPLVPEAGGRPVRKCRNYAEEKVCNWMVPAEGGDAYCPACELNEMIPNLSQPENRLYWYRLELAKRRLLYTLRALGLPIVSRRRDPVKGLAFRFLQDGPSTLNEQDRVLTGHSGGVITINLAEADDALREQMRLDMNERYRTVLGHFRHESAHYYWPSVVVDAGLIDSFRGLFGDERADYDAALKKHYANGPPPDWQERGVSRYASCHPWEDWAETWGHYLHMLDALETAQAWGMNIRPRRVRAAVRPAEETATDSLGSTFDEMCTAWGALTVALNCMNRSIGFRDFYPFALSPSSTAKLRFVHEAIAARARDCRGSAGAASAPAS